MYLEKLLCSDNLGGGGGGHQNMKANKVGSLPPYFSAAS